MRKENQPKPVLNSSTILSAISKIIESALSARIVYNLPQENWNTKMNNFKILHREMEVRLMRETIYKAIKAFKDGYDLTDDLIINECMMRHIGEFLRLDRHGVIMNWEDFIEDVFPDRFRENKIETQGNSQAEPKQE